MLIRAASPADVPAVLPMVAKIAALHESWDPQRYDYRDNPTAMYDRWLRARAVDPRSVFLVAERDTKLVAFLIATIEATIPIYRLQEIGFIHDLWVEPEYRNEGIARQMTMLAIEQFREEGVSQLRLETAAVNQPARALFKACGFRASTIEMLIDLKKP